VVSIPDGGTSQAGGSDTDSFGYSLSVTPIVCCSEESIMFVPNGGGLLVLKN